MKTIKTYSLDFCRPFLDPRWIRDNYHKKAEAVVKGGRVEIFGEKLKFEGEALPDGTEVQVFYDGNWPKCRTLQDVKALEAIRKAAERKKEEERRNKLNLSRKAAEAFNAALPVPVLWFPGIKDVLSGLSPTSWGDGRKKNTVQHVLLLEDLQEGRFKRYKGDFLCTAASGSNGKRWGGYDESAFEWFYDGDGNKYPAKVTCKACIKASSRWKGKIKVSKLAKLCNGENDNCNNEGLAAKPGKQYTFCPCQFREKP